MILIHSYKLDKKFCIEEFLFKLNQTRLQKNVMRNILIKLESLFLNLLMTVNKKLCLTAVLQKRGLGATMINLLFSQCNSPLTNEML